MTKSVAINRRAQRRRGDTLRTLVATILVAAAIVAVGLVTLHTVPGVTTPVELKILGIALAVGLDVLALSIAIGVMKIPWSSRIRLGLAFSVSEVLMQLIGYGIGTGAGRLIGTIANYLGFAVLAGVGVFIFRESFESKDSPFKVDSGWGLIAICASISLDSLGIGVSLPGVPLPLRPLLITVGVSTVLFTTVGLAFGSQLGQRYQQLAERVAALVLIALAAFFTCSTRWAGERKTPAQATALERCLINRRIPGAGVAEIGGSYLVWRWLEKLLEDIAFDAPEVTKRSPSTPATCARSSKRSPATATSRTLFCSWRRDRGVPSPRTIGRKSCFATQDRAVRRSVHYGALEVHVCALRFILL
jgi:putative Mn2+ efflux pump MntP